MCISSQTIVITLDKKYIFYLYHIFSTRLPPVSTRFPFIYLVFSPTLWRQIAVTTYFSSKYLLFFGLWRARYHRSRISWPNVDSLLVHRLRRWPNTATVSRHWINVSWLRRLLSRYSSNCLLPYKSAVTAFYLWGTRTILPRKGKEQ